MVEQRGIRRNCANGLVSETVLPVEQYVTFLSGFHPVESVPESFHHLVGFQVESDRACVYVAPSAGLGCLRVVGVEKIVLVQTAGEGIGCIMEGDLSVRSQAVRTLPLLEYHPAATVIDIYPFGGS